MCVFKPHRFSPLADDLQLLLVDTVSGLVASGLTSLSLFAHTSPSFPGKAYITHAMGHMLRVVA